MQPEKEKRNPQADAQLQPSCLPPVRNPFKDPGKKEKDSEWKRMQCGGVDEKRREEKDSEPSPKAEGNELSERFQKENVERVGAGVEEAKEAKLNSSDTYRGKQLPLGMKVKKRVSDEERKSPIGDGVEKVTDKVKEKIVEDHREPGEAEENISTSNIKAVNLEKINQTSQDLQKDSPQQPADGKTCLEQSDPTEKETVSKFSARDSDNTRHPTSDKPKQSPESRQTKEHQDNDDDDVVLVSVKPAAQKAPHVSAVQKPLTNFPGFQPASKVKLQQDDPRRLHSLLTAQLQQKKVSVKSTNGCLGKF